jgi:hypothetical protein
MLYLSVSGAVPFFMYDLANRQLITSPTIPGDITDSKDIVLTETPIPGLNYAPVMPSGGGNRKLSFTLPLVKRDEMLGNSILLGQFMALRNQPVGGMRRRLAPGQFSGSSKVLYYWGTHNPVPLVYWVASIKVTNRRGWVNSRGLPQVSDIDVELILDETHPLYLAEQEFMRMAVTLGPASQALSRARSVLSGRPY